MKLKMTVLLFMSFLMTSCSCLRVVTGIIYNAETQQSVSSARISVLNKGFERDFRSDSSGYFEADLTGGCRCPRMILKVESEGYKSVTFKEPEKRDTVMIFLEKEK